MRNFNPLFNPFNLANGGSPFATAGSSFAFQNASKGLFSRLGSSKVTLSGLLNGAQKTIGTVNQIVPLYNQIKPMIQNSKVILNVAKGLRIKPRNTRQNTSKVTPKNIVEVKVEKKEEKASNGSSPSKPFFI